MPKLNKKTHRWEHLTEGVIGYYCLTITKEYAHDKDAIPLNIIIERHKRHPTTLKRVKEISKLLNRKIYAVPAWGYKKHVINLNKKLTPAEITKKLLLEQTEITPYTSE